MSADDVFARFITSRVAAGCAETTLTWYRYMLRRFSEWLSANSLTYDTAKLIHLQEFQAHLRKQYAPSTVHQATTAIITFYRWLVEVELITTDPTLRLRRPRVPDSQPSVVTREYVTQLLASIQINVWMDYRDKLIIRLLFSTGIRLNECATLKIEHVELRNRRLSILGKGKRHRYVPVPRDLLPPFVNWLEHQRPPSPLPFVFLSSDARGAVRGAVSPNTIYYALKRREEEAGLDVRSAHNFRRGYAVDILLSGASTRLVQELLGHSSVQITERYLRLTPEATQGMFDDLWKPLE